MKPISIFFLSVLIIIIIQAASSSNQTLINSTCKTAANDNPNINFSFCTTSLQAAPASRCATLKGLGTISIRLIRYNITDTRCHIRQLLKNSKKLDPYVRQCLDDCFQLYSDAIPSVKEAMRLYNQNKFDDATTQISAIMTDSTTCEDGFGERKGVVSPLTSRNGYSFELSAIALSVMRIVQTGSG
ncbi:plant invertase/pectin methylesterase inhibitor [Striga asiatica]|uniref:Plant invertase/pectin methylesterase inhibitor n=1 Tax=Striga asiatica TaxID=4170 RepID=A0A5A7QZH6_STRAF|nr:plant invertase/pectin methylesterase inhibitor [Striga asiatica]